MRKRVLHVKSYTRMPYILHSGRAVTKVSPKRTREHNRLIDAVNRFSKDLKKTVETEKKHLQKHQQEVTAQKKRVQQQLLEAKRQQARERIEELERTRAILESQNKLAQTKIEGLDTLEDYRRRRLPVAPGSPVSKQIGKLRARAEFEKVRDDIIKNRAAALQQLEVMRTQRIANEAQLQAIRRGTKEEREAALKALTARTAESPLAKITAAVATIPGKVVAPAKQIAFIMNAQREAVEAAKRKAQEQERESALKTQEAVTEIREKGKIDLIKLQEEGASKERIESVKRGMEKESDYLTRQAAQETAERNAHTQLEIAKIAADAQKDIAELRATSPLGQIELEKAVESIKYMRGVGKRMEEKSAKSEGDTQIKQTEILTPPTGLPPEKGPRPDVR